MKDIFIPQGLAPSTLKLGNVPTYNRIPPKFKDPDNPYLRAAKRMISEGSKDWVVFVRKDVQTSWAMKIVKAVSVAIELNHEHRESATAYFLHRFFRRIIIKRKGETECLV